MGKLDRIMCSMYTLMGFRFEIACGVVNSNQDTSFMLVKLLSSGMLFIIKMLIIVTPQSINV